MPPKPRRQPQRTCVACRQVAGKRGLVRVVRTPAGEVSIDATGRLSGRGAYLCARRSCWDLALKRKALDRALKVTLDAATVERLAAFGRDLPDEADEGADTDAAMTNQDA
ncbi:MAG: YlxR family protein [Chloroflexi bacterium]|jgi:predicted RNA-binding protein YlxR (DUF448 family)|nr:YlxR family protein [Chloroflexota bacterium]